MDLGMDVIDTRRWKRASQLLDQALDLPHDALETWLLDLKATDTEAGNDVEALLNEHRQLEAEGFLDAGLPAVDVPLAGVTLGGYTLVSPIDQGGMGSVWLAERSDGRYQGRAAVKLLNVALLGKEGEARFRREGTVLARLTHPHIGRLIDAGVSRAGQPYLVLEYIDGHHIDRYCDDARLDVEGRVRLFLDVASAVAHAHANLIVHRDLKPSNVLVTTDGQVKLLDFGIAKLLSGDDEAAASLLTREGVALTPKYAAPEQVTGGAITTATDVYTLGVLLYELLTGQHPTGLAAGSPVEFVKAITVGRTIRLSSAALGANATLAEARADQRATTPDRLRRALKGDLETIVAKALKQNPAERYPSVAELAEDLRRVLDRQPITARPDSVRYRATKFVQRHWKAIGAAAAALTVLVAVITFYTVRLATERDRARQEAERARIQAHKAERMSELITSLLRGADPYRSPDSEPTVQGLLDAGLERTDRELGDEPEIQTAMLALIGRTYERMGHLDKAQPVLERAVAAGRRLGAANAQLAQSLNNLGVLHREMDRLTAAEPLLREALTMRRQVLGPRHPDVAITLVELTRVLVEQGRMAEAEALARESLEIRRAALGDQHRETAVSKGSLGMIRLRLGDVAGAEALIQESLDTNRRQLGPTHPNTGAAYGNLVNVLIAKGDYAAAEPLARQSADIIRGTFGTEHDEYAQKLNTLGNTIEPQGRLAEAEALFADAVRIGRTKLPPQHLRVLIYLTNLGRVQVARGKAAAAEPMLREVLRGRERALPAGDWRIAQAQSLLGAALLARGRVAEAEPLMRAADAVLQPVRGVQGREREANRARLATLTPAASRTAPRR
jgi:eukaryotic-like serine/threonine-protein kinase